METITIKKEEYERLKIENKTLKKELENTKEPTEFLGKKASEWLKFKELVERIMGVELINSNFDNSNNEKIQKILGNVYSARLKADNLEFFVNNMQKEINKLKEQGIINEPKL